MPEGDVLAAFPSRVQASTQRPDLWYERVPGLFAVQGPIPALIRASPVLVLGDGAAAVLRGSPGRDVAGPGMEAVTPVYALHPGGPPAVPTGLVFVRFVEPVRAAERRDQLAQAGYTVSEIPGYAPQAAWVRAAHGDIAAALAGLPALAAMPDVVNVEPQMLSESARR